MSLGVENWVTGVINRKNKLFYYEYILNIGEGRRKKVEFGRGGRMKGEKGNEGGRNDRKGRRK